MEQTNKWSAIDWVILLISLAPIFAAWLLYDQLPEQMASHFDSNFQPDDYQDKFTFLLILSILSLLPVALKYIRRFDPKRDNYEKFIRAFNIFRLATSLLLSLTSTMVLLYALGYEQEINMRLLVFSMLGLFYIITGNYFGQIRHNYFMGIRTPWTLANEDVWRKTHRLAGPLWMIGGLLFLAGAFLPEVSVPWLIVPILVVTTGIPYVASYLYFRKMQ